MHAHRAGHCSDLHAGDRHGADIGDDVVSNVPTDPFVPNTIADANGYALSKRTELYALASFLRNNAGWIYNYSTDSVGPIGLGARLSGFGAGIVHTS
ncbi:hypothetical protein PTE30175_03146 [Pandoraea terrae]|uniref:Uncharacterized protein n=1 Tax=Pandoraea terrae TaxID=1537710 RepID=A0A5E4WDY0_9BURK|nr:hypothetical protein [Pandoraea terrae]VVE22818.1 hypothetical protein PTE30175_03146 [Pandoraea terrae]